MTEPHSWKVKAAEFRRMAQTAHEVERERKLLALAADLDERAGTAESRPEPARPQ